MGTPSAQKLRVMSPPDNRPYTLIFPCILLAAFLLVLVSRARVTDFVGFLVGAKLLGTKGLYDVAANMAVQPTFAGWKSAGVIFVRPPFFAFCMKPFLSLPFATAVLLWRVLLITALFLAGWVLPSVPSQWKTLALSFSFPAYACIAFGGDAPVVFLMIALSLYFWSKGHGLLAGLMLGLCLGKFHYLLFLPLLLFRKRFQAPLLGFSLTAGALLVLNFMVQPDWVPLYWQGLHIPQENMNAQPSLMPNLYAAFFWTGHPEIIVAIGTVLITGVLWRVSRNCSFELGVALCVLGAMLVSPHTNGLDSILAIPAFLIGAQTRKHVGPLACLILSPFAAFLYCSVPTFGPSLFVAMAAALLYCCSVMPLASKGRYVNGSQSRWAKGGN